MRYLIQVVSTLGLLAAIAGAAAQPLPVEAADALGRAQRLAAEAQLRYTEHFPDLPLWSDALAAGREAAAAAPEHPAPQRFLAQAYGQVGFHARAWTAWQRYLELGGAMDAQVATHLRIVAEEMGIRTHDGGRRQASIPYLEALVALDPNHVGAHERLARWHLEHGDHAAALPHLEAVGDRVPDLAAAVGHVRLVARHGELAVEAYDAGVAAAAAGRRQQALTHFGEAAAASDAFIEAWRRAGSLALELGLPAEAERYLAHAHDLAPDDASIRADLDLARAQRAVGPEAFAAYQAGLAAYRASDLGAARGHFTEATRRNPRYVDAFAWLGRVAFESDDFELAVHAYRHALELEPGRPEFVEFLAQSERLHTQALEEQARAEEAARAAAAARAEAEARARAEAAARARADAEARARAAAEAEAEAAAVAAAEAEAREEAERREREEAAAQARAEAEAEAQRRAAAEAATAEEAVDDAATAEDPAVRDPSADAAPDPVAEDAPAEAEVVDAAPPPPAPAAAAPPDADAAAGPAAAPAAPAGGSVILAEATVEHRPTETGTTSAVVFLYPPSLDVDLTAYASGVVHHRIEVVSKPSEAPVHYQLCLIPPDIMVRPACSDAGTLSFTGAGTYEARQPVGTFSGAGAIDWAAGLQGLMLVVRHPDGAPIDAHSLAERDGLALADFYPMVLRYRAVLVPDGTAFAGWR